MNGTASDVVGRVSLTTSCRTLSVSNIVTPVHYRQQNYLLPPKSVIYYARAKKRASD